MMTPKEKANELVKRYVYFNSSILQMMSGKYSNGIAKQCALIAVDEILNNDNNFFNTYSQNDYWLQVKQEIKLL